MVSYPVIVGSALQVSVMKDRQEAIEDRVKELLKDRKWSGPTMETLGFDTVMDPILRFVYALGWAHAEEDFASDYLMLEARLSDPGPEWKYLKKLAKRPIAEDENPASKRVVLAERAQELVEVMRTEHEDVINGLRALPSVAGGLPGRLAALKKLNEERIVRLKAINKKATPKTKSRRTAGKR